jgi:hypothetical protein
VSDVTRFAVAPQPEESDEPRETTALSRLRLELQKWLADLAAEDEAQREALAREVRELRKADTT